MNPGNHSSRPQRMRIADSALTILLAVLAATTFFSTRLARADARGSL